MPSLTPRRTALVIGALLVILVTISIPTRMALSGAPATATPTSTGTPTPSATLESTSTARPADAPSPTILASATPQPSATAEPTPTIAVSPTSAPVSSGYWHTSGARIVDSNGRTVRIAAVTWFGMENVFYVPAGLDRQPLESIMARVQQLGFNAIRLPFSNQLVERNPVVMTHLEANLDLQGKHALDILDQIVAAAGRHNIRIILDDGRSNTGTPPQENGLWYTEQFPEHAWIHDWVTLVKRYADNPTVVGVDLRNEPHTGPPGPWSISAYLHQGSTWGPYHGVSNPASDWRLAAERAGNAVLEVNPRLLIIVEGLQLYPDPSALRGVDTYWWGGALQGAGPYPVRLAVAHQLVYSPHEYGPAKVPMRFFGPNMSYSSLSAVWNEHWGYLVNGRSPVPIFIGEFGTCGQPACVSDTKPGSAGLWFSYWMRYLQSHPTISWSFWALNGTNQRGVDMKHYLLRSDWRSVRLSALIKRLRAIGLRPQPGALSAGRATG